MSTPVVMRECQNNGCHNRFPSANGRRKFCEPCQEPAVSKRDVPPAPDLSAGACFDSPEPDLWFQNDDISLQIAIGTCGTCPLKDTCREWAIKSRQEFGVWGGQHEDERRSQIRRERRAKVAS